MFQAASPPETSTTLSYPELRLNKYSTCLPGDQAYDPTEDDYSGDDAEDNLLSADSAPFTLGSGFFLLLLCHTLSPAFFKRE